MTSPERHVQVTKGHEDGPGDDWSSELTVAEVIEGILREDLIHISGDHQVIILQVTGCE